MKKRPNWLTLLALFLLAVAVGIPLQIMALHEHLPSEGGAILAKLAPLNWAIMVAAPVAAWLAFRASRWVIVALPALVALVGYNNWLVARAGTDYPGWFAAAGTVLFALAVVPLFHREVRDLLRDPGRRWWLTPARKRLQLPVRLKILLREDYRRRYVDWSREFYIKTFDLSEGGAFIPISQISGAICPAQEKERVHRADLTLEDIPVGTQCFVSMPIFGTSYVQCRAEIVRNAQARGNYPAGLGVRFLGLSWAEQRALAEYLSRAA